MTRATDMETARQLTVLLRESNEPFWARIRSLLLERSITPSEVALGQCFPDDTDFEFGILATADGRIIQFGYSYAGTSAHEGTFAEWEDITDIFESAPSRDYALAARAVLPARGRVV